LALRNDVYFGINATTGPAEFDGSTTNSSWFLPTLLPATTIYWQIIARKLGVTAGPVWQFRTAPTLSINDVSQARRQFWSTPLPFSTVTMTG
jgi:hypothetical protein